MATPKTQTWPTSAKVLALVCVAIVAFVVWYRVSGAKVEHDAQCQTDAQIVGMQVAGSQAWYDAGQKRVQDGCV